MNLPNGTQLQGGKYRIEGVLGQGGFGITYRATHMVLGTQVAIKEFFLNGVNGRDADNKSVTVSLEVNRDGFASQRNKFRKEAQRLQSLSSDHIVKVYDYFDENGTSYYVMEHIDGSSLEQWAKHNGGRMSESQVTNVLNQTLSALQVMHNRNIWHLDIKPNNIMRTSNGIIKLIDFGASKMIDSDHTMTTSSAIASTPGFAPLEQMAGDLSSFGPWTDFYALGATLYVLLTGNRPPTANDILSSGFASFAWPSVVTSDIQRLIVDMMNPIRNKRPQNVAEVKRLVQQPSKLVDQGVTSKRGQAEKYFDEHVVEILQNRGLFEQKKAFVKKVIWSGFFAGFVCAWFFVMWYLGVDDWVGLIFCCFGGIAGGGVTTGLAMLILAAADSTVHNRLQSQIRESFIEEYIKTH